MSITEIEEIDSEEIDLFEHYRFVADKKQTLLRIDKFLMDRIANATRNKVQNAITNGTIKVNDQSVKPNYKIRPDDVVTVFLPKPPRDEDILGEDIKLDIVFEDDYLLIVNKPAGMVVHPAYNNWTGTLVNALVFYFDNLPTTQNGAGRPGLVHRIDKDTSGLLVIAKTEIAMSGLAKQFYDHSIDRCYHAIIWSSPDEKEGTIDTYLNRSVGDRRIITVYKNPEDGKKAITHYKVIENFQFLSVIECKLETGRTHQIRAHMKHIGHPIFSDATYGGDKILKGTANGSYKQFIENCFQMLPRQALHAKTLGFTHPITKERMFFEIPLPEDMQQTLDKMRKYFSSVKRL